MKPEQEVIYIRDVALILGKEYPAVQAMQQRGHLPKAFKLGGKVAWLRGDFMAWLAGLADATKAAQERQPSGNEAAQKTTPGRKRLLATTEIISSHARV